MNNKMDIEYPALVYKKNIFYIANCVMQNLFAVGKTEKAAIESLEAAMNKALPEYNITIRPTYDYEYVMW
jgi:predicted RNase H-like HicB family nuclease